MQLLPMILEHSRNRCEDGVNSNHAPRKYQAWSCGVNLPLELFLFSRWFTLICFQFTVSFSKYFLYQLLIFLLWSPYIFGYHCNGGLLWKVGIRKNSVYFSSAIRRQLSEDTVHPLFSILHKFISSIFCLERLLLHQYFTFLYLNLQFESHTIHNLFHMEQRAWTLEVVLEEVGEFVGYFNYVHGRGPIWVFYEVNDISSSTNCGGNM